MRQSVKERLYGAGTDALDRYRLVSVIFYGTRKMYPGARLTLKLFFAEFMVEKLIRSADIAIFFTEQLKYLIGSEFLTLFITGLLNYRSEFGCMALGIANPYSCIIYAAPPLPD